MASGLELSVSLADYHRTRPLLSGEAGFKGIAPKYHPAAPGEACLRPIYEEFDVAEMSLSWYAMARFRGEPVYALPIFPLRMFVHAYVFCRDDSGISKPEDLRGKRVGMDVYRLTVGLWTRGIFEEHYGVSPRDIHWFTTDPEGAGFEPPPGVKITQTGEDPSELLLRGEIDAVIAPNVPPQVRAAGSRLRRLFPDCRGTIGDYFDKTGIFPTTHTLVVRQDLLEREPWIVDSLVDGFQKAEDICRRQYEYPKRLAFPTGVLLIEEEEKRFGKNPWQHGLGANRHTLERFMRYAFEQGYTGRRLSVDECFWGGASAATGGMPAAAE
jgi:4,5-dihydroxyphthalate decarboxylase